MPNIYDDLPARCAQQLDADPRRRVRHECGTKASWVFDVVAAAIVTGVMLARARGDGKRSLSLGKA